VAVCTGCYHGSDLGEPRDTASGPDLDAGLGAETLSDAEPLRRTQLIERGTAIGRYVVIEAVGSGGMSTVYAAYDPELDRRVALKVMRATSEDSETVRDGERSRLLREAQAMARLSHPNVVTVHDVGTFGERVFLAMHFVDGETLTPWVRHAGSWREIVEIYGYAGRGLAAAHRVGLVHRDFKPDNVLIDRERRVRVTDFGLARPIGSALASESSTPLSLASSSSRLERPITLAGSIMGTPAYMAPEQYLGRNVDARTDQFSFCVALWEALVGERPFRGETLGEVAHAVTNGEVQPFPAKSPVPARIRRALLRGLSARADDRFATIDELLRELTPPSRRRPLLLAAAGAGLVALGAIASNLGGARAPEDPCTNAAEVLDPTWSDTRRAAVQASLANEHALDEAAGARAIVLVDDFAARWRAVALDACRLNKVTASQSDTAFEARSRCLQRRRAELDLQLVRIEHGTAASIGTALGGLHALVQPEVCDDIELLMQTRPPPDDPAIRVQIDELETRARAVESAIELDVSSALRPRVDELVLEARRLGYAPMIAKTYLLDSQLREVEGDIDGSEQALYAMTAAAGSGHDAEQLIQGWTALTYLVGQLQGRSAEGLQLARVGEVEISRNGYPYDTILLLSAKGAVYQAANDHVHARDAWQQALAMLDLESRARPSVRAVLLNNLGTLDLLEGDTLAALDRFRGARDIATELFGPQYPRLADNYLNMCLAHTTRGEFGEATAECEHALALLERPGSDKGATARVLLGLVMPTLGIGHIAEAGELAKRASVAVRESYGDRSYAAAAAEVALAQTSLYAGDPAATRRHALLAEEILRELGPAFEAMRYEAQTWLGLAAFGEQDLAAALAHCSEAIALAEDGLGVEHPSLLEPLACRGAALVGLGRAREAVPALERALAIHTRSGGDPLAVSHARYSLAEAVLAEDRVRARALVIAARRDLEPLNPRVERYAGELDAWLESHR
jgi:eukaryotic-like serine/threonine-protein kinase